MKSNLMPLFLAVTFFCVAGCSSDDDKASGTCTPYESMCINDSVYVCQPDGQVTFSRDCEGCCIDGDCHGDAATGDGCGGAGDGAGAASDGTGDGTDGGTGTPGGDACTNNTQDQSLFPTGEAWGKIKLCMSDCSADSAAAGCIKGCLGENFSDACGDCVGAWAQCLLSNCTDDCAHDPSTACIDCATGACTPAFTECSGITRSEFSTPDGGIPDGTTGDETGGDPGGETDGHDGDPGGDPGGETGGGPGGDPGGDPGGESGGETGSETGGETGGTTGQTFDGACTEQDLTTYTTYPIWDCAEQCEHNLPGSIPGFKNCVADCLTGPFTAGCAVCFADFIWCFEDDCHDACGDNVDSPTCNECAANLCAPPMKECGGIDVL